MPDERATNRRDPGLLLAVALIIALAPIGWVNAVGQMLLPTNVPVRTAPPANPPESRRAGATFGMVGTTPTATAPVLPSPTAPPPTLAVGIVPDSDLVPHVAATPEPTPVPVVAETQQPAPSPTAPETATAVPTPAAPMESPTAAPTPASEPPIAVPTLAPTQAPPPSPTPMPSRTPVPRTPTPQAVPATGTTYVVQAGDTLWSIASRHGVDLARLRAVNQIGEDNAIRVGQTLQIPRTDGIGGATVGVDLLSDVARDYGVPPSTVAEASSRLSASAPSRGDVQAIAGTNSRAAGASTGASASGGAGAAVPAASLSGELRSASRSPSSAARLRWPALGGISTFFGEEGHSGLDIMGSMGQPVTAASAGTVSYVTKGDGPYGWRIDVDHGSGMTTVYAHLSEIGVKVGDQVSTGQRIGAVGNTGLSTGPHLHFEVRLGGSVVDPLDYLR